jgi:hypothetical protein
MRRRFLVALLLLTPVLAQANPVIINPASLLAFCYVAFWAFVVEAGLVALLLLFRGLAPLRVFMAFFMANGLIFFFLFQPLLDREWLPLPVLEVMVVLIDSLVIKLLVSLNALQGDDYGGVSWSFSTVISGVGNAASYLVGYFASHKPWEG